MTKVEIYLKGGASIHVDLKEFALTRSPITNGITKVAWTSGKDKPLYISPDDIAAVIER